MAMANSEFKRVAVSGEGGRIMGSRQGLKSCEALIENEQQRSEAKVGKL